MLDASALIALLRREAGAAQVEAVVSTSLMSTVNLGEVLGKLVDYGMPEMEAFAAVAGLGIAMVDVDVDLARDSARLRKATRGAGLSLGDRICLALGARLDLPVVTADRVWATLGLPLDIRVIR